MTKKPGNQAFEEYLQGGSNLSRRYHETSQAQPPKHLDEKILAASRKAVDAKPRLAYSPFSSTWTVPVSLAAVLVLSVGLVVSIQDESGQPLPGKTVSGDFTGTASIEYRGEVEAGETFRSDMDKTAKVFKDEEEGRVMSPPEVDYDIAAPVDLYDSPPGHGIAPSAKMYAPRPSQIEIMEQKRLENTEREKQGIRQRQPMPKLKTIRKRESRKEITDETGMIKKDIGRAVAGEAMIEPAASAVPEMVLDGLIIQDDEQANAPLEKQEALKRHESLLVDEVLPESQTAGPATEVEWATPEEWLHYINRLWEQGKHKDAKENMQRFLFENPDYSMAEINRILATGDISVLLY